ncbi:MAG: hypothetical protein DA407_02735 [Bacteroidetes bacterium]|nr:MAG: hypothetical protein DA407_02735 [Bacteroidota bacterium]
MRKITLLLLIACAFSFAQNTVTVGVDAAPYLGYMNVTFTPADGGGAAFDQGWGVPDLVCEVGATSVTLKPNVNGYANSLGGNNGDRAFWTNSPDGGVTAGPDGNKIMEAISYIEPGSSFNGNDLTFTGEVTSNTINARYSAQFFIKALDPMAGYSDIFAGSKTIDLPSSGVFSISATGAELTTGLIVQYGFVITGLNANPADDWGSVVIEPVVLSTDKFELSQVKAFPNPTNNVWNIKTNNQNIESVVLYDILGKQVLSTKPNTSNVEINSENLSNGLYFAKVRTNSGEANLRLVKN